MYALLSGLWKCLFTKVQYQVLILGLDEAGKTTLLEQIKNLYSGLPNKSRLSHSRLSKIPPTVGLNIGKVDVGLAKLIFWDLGGQVGLRVIWDKYYSDSHAIIYVVDSVNMSRMEEAAKEMENILNNKELSDAPILLLANKQDLTEAIDTNHITKLLDFHMQPNRPVHIQEISAITGAGIEQGLTWLIETLPRSKRTLRVGTEYT